ncbi:MAG: FecR domain-containing protein, partial [Acidobacteriota bacterium]|nr:FecR domain-containing protein [Acidobacteriota bacterium]
MAIEAAKRWCGASLLVLALASHAGAAAGQHPAGGETANDTAVVRAVRLTFVQGRVDVDAGERTGSQPAQPNMPLVTGARLSTGEDGEAEVEFEDGSVLRLTPNSTLAFDRLGVSGGGVFATELSLLRGLAYAELRATAQNRYSLAAGGDVLTPVENTSVRVNFDDPPAVFAVLDGTAEVSRRDGSVRREARAGESLRVNGGGQYDLTQGIPEESWDAWNGDRDRAEADEAKSATGVRGEYAGAQGYGWSDLDANGTWYDVQGQGPVWQPAVAAVDAGFDPYGSGSWVWYPGTGYVWASGYGWGWTPYRCGSWSYFPGFGWGWTPGGCAGEGWRFGGVGKPVNVAVCPGGYRVPHVPHPHPGPVNPVLPVRVERGGDSAALAGQTGWGAVIQRGPRQINGVEARPVERNGMAALRRGGGEVDARRGASALDRDFPVDRESHAAILGRQTMQPAVVRTETGWRRDASGGRGIAAPAGGWTGQGGASVESPAAAQGQRPVYRQREGAAARPADSH